MEIFLHIILQTKCYVNGSFDIDDNNSRTKKIKNNSHKDTRGFNVVRLTMPIFMDEREFFYYTVENIIEV